MSDDILYKNEIINKMLMPIAKDLQKKYAAVIGAINIERILFLKIDTAAPKLENGYTFGEILKSVKVSKIPLQMGEVIYQMTNETYFWKIEFKSWLFSVYDANAITALLYHCLRCISPEGKIISPDRCGWTEVVETLGSNWLDPCNSCEDILKKDVFSWSK